MRRHWLGLVGGVILAACSPGGAPSDLAPSAMPAISIPQASLTPLAFAPPVRATAVIAERPVVINAEVDGRTIPDRYEEWYVLTNDRARRIGIRLEPIDGRGALRFGIRVIDATGRSVPRVQSPVGQPLLRDEWDLPGQGEYVIQLFGSEERERAFKLSVVGVPVAESGGGTIAYGETRSGAIVVRGQRDDWTLTGDPGDRATITMVSDGADPHLAVYDAGGRLLAENDDSGLGRNAALEVTLPSDGQVLIVVRMVSDDQTGAYRLMADRAAP